MTAALVGTIAANAFYLTMSFYYFARARQAGAGPAERTKGEEGGASQPPEGGQGGQPLPASRDRAS